MKKVIVMLIISIALVNSFSFAEIVTERPDIKIVVNGETIKNSNTPIIVNSRTLLPLRELITALGVPNDEEHIIWDNDARMVIINYEDTHIELFIDSNIAKVNGEIKNLDAPAIIYKEFTYIPARFVGETLNKKIGWDSYDSRVLIRDLEDFEKVKELFNSTEEIMNNVKRLKSSSTINLSYVKTGETLDVKSYSEVNIENEELYSASETKINNEITTVEQYVKGVNRYLLNNLGIWEKQETNADFSSFIAYIKELTNISANDETFYDIFSVDEEKSSPSIIVLKNDISYKGLILEISEGTKYVQNDMLQKIKDIDIEYKINNKTKTLDSIEATLLFEDEKMQDDICLKVNISIDEFNTDFEVYNPII